MMKKCIILCFLGFLGVFSVWNVFAPKADFSEEENRTLAKMPETSFSHIISGQFDDEFESYFSDHFVLRNQWIPLKAMSRRAFGTMDNNDVFFGKDNWLIRRFQSFQQRVLDQNVALLKEFSDTTQKPIHVLLVPTAAHTGKNYLPTFAWNIDQEALLKKIQQQLPQDSMIPLTFPEDAIEYYFRSDHHWNEKGAYLGYEAIANQVLRKEPNSFRYTKVSDSFYGTMYSRSGAFWITPDSIYKIEPENNVQVTSITYDDSITKESIYEERRLEEKDKYTYYLDGNHAHVSIQTTAPNNTHAIVMKDSYAHILMPYLVSEYSQIDIYDLRYYRDSVSDSIRDNSDIYFIYSIDNFCTDSNMVFLK